MSGHTRGPWRVIRMGGAPTHIMGGTHGRVTIMDSSYLWDEEDANADRIVACVNALAPLDNKTVERLAAYLEQHNNDTVADMLREEGF